MTITFRRQITKMNGISNIKKSFLLITFFFSSCITTKLAPTEISEDLQRLSYANCNQVCININGNLKKNLGHQFVIPFIPVGEIILEKLPKSYVYSSMYKVLSLAHFTPKFNSNTCKDILTINIQDLSLTAYDLFFTRRIVGQIKYQIIYTRNGVIHDTQEDRVKTSYYKRYAFKPELEYVLNKTLDEFSKNAVDMMKFF